MQTIKPASESSRGIYAKRKSTPKFSLHLATLVILSVLGFLSAIAISWLLGNSHVTELFIQLHLVQANPPRWLMPPHVSNQYYLLTPAIILFAM
ncbi:MAG: cellulose synthase catalytic subunit, partial [Pleurocapsa sp.]